jgi:hypothetical protein
MNKGVMNLVIKAIDNATPTLRTVGKGLGGLKKIGATVGNDLKRVAIGLGGLAAGLAGFTALAVKAAIEDEAAASRLNATLKARGLATDSVTAAIEAQIVAAQKLGFTDDDVRGSVEVSTRFTKNYAIAQKMQTVAMDLARSSGMTLEEATLAVGKAYQGTGGKLLKNLGITKNGIKGQEAMNAILNKTRGSALAYSKTTQGAFDALVIGAGELKESFGDAFRGAITKLFIGLQPYLERFSNYIKAATPTIQKFADKLVTKFLAKLPGYIASAEEKLPSLFRQFGDFVDSIKGVGKEADRVLGPGGAIRVAITGIGTALGGLRGGIASNLLASGVDPIKAYFISTAASGILTGIINGMTASITSAAVTKFFALFKNVPMTVTPSGAPAPGSPTVVPAGGGFNAAPLLATAGIFGQLAQIPEKAGRYLDTWAALFGDKTAEQKLKDRVEGMKSWSLLDHLASALGLDKLGLVTLPTGTSVNAGTGVSANPMNDKYTVVIGGKAVDGVVKDSLGRIIGNIGGGR